MVQIEIVKQTAAVVFILPFVTNLFVQSSFLCNLLRKEQMPRLIIQSSLSSDALSVSLFVRNYKIQQCVIELACCIKYLCSSYLSIEFTFVNFAPTNQLIVIPLKCHKVFELSYSITCFKMQKVADIALCTCAILDHAWIGIGTMITALSGVQDCISSLCYHIRAVPIHMWLMVQSWQQSSFSNNQDINQLDLVINFTQI